jgi:YidC/Oxa1 family membrane protein insertase
VVGAPFLPLAILFYWVSNNLWTLGQQYLVYKRIDAEDTEKRDKAAQQRSALAPRPGQKPNRNGSEPEPVVEQDSSDVEEPPAKKPGAKPVNKPKPGAKPVNRSGGAGGRPGGGGNRTQARKGRKRR